MHSEAGSNPGLVFLFHPRHLNPCSYSRLMKTRRLLFSLCAITLSLCGALAKPAATDAPTKSTASTKHCLWEVRGSSNTVFLLGSMHVMKSSMYPLAPEIEAAYKRARVVVFETDMKAMESPEFAIKLMNDAKYPEGESLKGHLSAAVYSQLTSSLGNGLVGMDMLNQFKPWMVATTLLMLELQKQGFDPQNGVDQHFHKRAVEDTKKLDEFETPEFQMSLLSGLTEKESEEVLAQTLKDLDILKKQFDELAAAWTTGDVKAMDKLIVDTFREYPSMHKKFLLDRNRAWIAKLEKLLQGDKDALVVVGAGHLIGKDSVVDLLAGKKYKVEQR